MAAEKGKRGFVLGSKLTELRESKGWTQEELSRRTGISRILLSRYEHGTMPNQKNFKHLLKAFGLRSNYFYEMSVANKANHSDDPSLNDTIEDLLELPKDEQKIVISLIRSIKDKYSKGKSKNKGKRMAIPSTPKRSKEKAI